MLEVTQKYVDVLKMLEDRLTPDLHCSVHGVLEPGRWILGVMGALHRASWRLRVS